MEYRWDDYTLDREGTLLTRQGQQIDVSRKVLDCIGHLLEHRQRVVGYDELMRKVWGHDKITNHQLTQIIVVARRTIGDDGQAQRLIRTMSGLGYRWVGPVCEVTETVAALHVQAPEALSQTGTPTALQTQAPKTPLQTDVDAATPARSRSGKQRLLLAFGAMLMALAAVAWQFQDQRPVAMSTPPTMAAAADPLTHLEERLWRGDADAVRQGLATLPMALVDSADGRILEIRLDVERGRYERAAQKLALQQDRSKAAADTVWQAKLLTLLSVLNAKAGKPGPEVLIPAQQAVVLLESVAQKVPPSVMGEALSARGTGFMFVGQFETAMSDLVHARDILLEDGEKRRATTTRHMLAHVWLRMGRLADALDEFKQIARLSEQLQNPAGEVLARNTATRIQIELLLWDEALANSRRSMKASKKLPDSTHRAYTTRLHSLVLTSTGHLREAASLLEETDAEYQQSSVAAAMYHIASSNAESALANSAAMFIKFDASSNSNLILSSQEGALLLWTIAAQDLVAQGNVKPPPSAAQLDVLRRPESTPGRIARGRWLWSEGMRREAEVELRFAFDESRKMNRLFHMTLAAEPLIGLLLENKNFKAADAVLASLRGINPDRMDRDYRVNVLRLRAALAKGEITEIQDAHRRALVLARERALPIEIHSSQGMMYSYRTAVM